MEMASTVIRNMQKKSAKNIFKGLKILLAKYDVLCYYN